MKVVSVYRPRFLDPSPDTSSAFSFDSTFHAPGLEMDFPRQWKYASGLIVHFDVSGDGTKIIQRGIRFTDHTGLEQEITDGTSVTILNSLLQSMVDTIGSTSAENDSTNPVYLNSYIRGQLVNRTYTPSLS